MKIVAFKIEGNGTFAKDVPAIAEAAMEVITKNNHGNKSFNFPQYVQKRFSSGRAAFVF